jgi:hypothetical protein
LNDVFDAEAAFDLDPRRNRATGEDRFEMFHLDHRARAGRTWQTIRPLRAVDLVEEELNAGKMAAGAPRLVHPMCSA